MMLVEWEIVVNKIQQFLLRWTCPSDHMADYSPNKRSGFFYSADCEHVWVLRAFWKINMSHCATQCWCLFITSTCTCQLFNRSRRVDRTDRPLGSKITFIIKNKTFSCKIIRQFWSWLCFLWRIYEPITDSVLKELRLKANCYVGFVRHCPLHIILNGTLTRIGLSKIPIWTIIEHFLLAFQLSICIYMTTKPLNLR